MENLSLDSNPFRNLFRYIQKYRWRFRLAISNSFINKLLDLAPPVLVGWAVDTVTGRSPAFITWFGSDPFTQGLTLAILGILIFAFESVFEWISKVGFMGIAQDVQHDLRVDAYTKMQQREMEFFENHRVGETMSMLSDDVNQLERFLNNVFNDYVQLVSMIVISGAILLNTSVALSLIAIVPIPVIVWGSISFQKLLAPRYKAVREAVGWLNTRLENNLSGIAVIKAFTAERFETSRLQDVSHRYRLANIRAIRLASAFSPLIRMGVAIGFGGVLLFGTVWTLDGTLTPGEFTLFSMMCQRILWPLTGLGRILDETERCRASAARVFGLLASESKIFDRPNPVRPSEVMPAFAFRNVSFQYAIGQPILDNINLAITPGETVGVAGATGAGKSTFVKLMLRLYDPTEGEVLFSQHSLKDLKLSWLRQHISLVSQDVYLFQGTIAENISYGHEDMAREHIVEASKNAKLHEFVETLPDGYDTLVGERGIKLSGGQRQRLSIARAILKNAPVLILDEATSSVDTETERAIQENLDRFTTGKTAIIIAHRLSTLRNADRIIVLDRGRISQEGRHQELVDSGGVYADLWKLQVGN